MRFCRMRGAGARAPDHRPLYPRHQDAVGLRRRLGVVEACGKVVLADGIRAKEEEHCCGLVVKLAGINRYWTARRPPSASEA